MKTCNYVLGAKIDFFLRILTTLKVQRKKNMVHKKQNDERNDPE